MTGVSNYETQSITTLDAGGTLVAVACACLGEKVGSDAIISSVFYL
jgi:hypothetical protein